MHKGFKDSRAFAVACKMPVGLKHKQGEDYDPFKSQIIEWLIAQPELRNYLFDKCNTAGAIVFDPESRTWKGRDS